jgi:hypothetical protein
MLIHFLYQDEPNVSRFQSGLVTLRGAAKPALGAFELPLVEVSRAGTATSLWGQLRAPGAGSTATIERKVGSAWRRVATVHSGTSHTFAWRGTLPKGAVIRLRAGSLAGAPLTVF